MKEKIITSIIPKTHRNIILFLGFTFLFGFFTFIALLEGISIDRLTFKGVIVEKLYLKWNNALLIRASKIDLSALKGDNTPITLKPLSKLPPLVRNIQHWVYQIDIDTIQYKETYSSLHYHKGSNGTFVLRNRNYTCQGTYTLDDKSFDLMLPPCIIDDANISLTLNVELAKQSLKANIAIILPETPTLHILAAGDTDTLSFKMFADQVFTTVKPLVKVFGLDPHVQPWISEYAKADSITLHRLEGKFHYDKPDELLGSLQAEATVNQGEYTFAPGFEPIKAPRVELSFHHGKLYITPYEGTFYTLPTEQSSLFIDFSAEHTTLTTHIKTAHAMLNDPILSLLHFYKIDLPIKQASGTCDVDLNLSVDLHTLDTTAQGEFRPSASDILLDQISLKSEGGIVNLNNTRVSFENFTAHYGDNIADAYVKGDYDASSNRGIVSIDAYAVSPLANKQHLSLRNPLKVNYIITPKGDTLSIASSQWNVLGKPLNIESFRAPFDYHTAQSTLKSVHFSLNNTIHGTIDALLNGSTKQTDVRLQLDDFKLGDVQLQQSPLKLGFHYDHDGITLNSDTASAWSVHQLPLLVSPFEASMNGDELIFKDIEAVLGDLLKGKFSGKYQIDTKKGSILISDMIPLSPKIFPILDAQKSLNLNVDASKNEIVLDVDALKARFTTIPKGWKIALSDISLLSQKSPLLRKYNIDNGYLNLFYSPESSHYNFNGSVIYPYPIMMVNEKPVTRYNFSGVYYEGQTKIRINDRLVLTRNDEKIDVSAKNAGINMPQLFRFLTEHQPEERLEISSGNGTQNHSDEILPVQIHAVNTYLYLMKGRKIVADNLDATLNNDDMDATLSHMGGTATLKIRNGLFMIDGNGFNDTFMEHLFRFSDFTGGKFSFEAKGEAEAFDGVMRVENSILKDYKVLNNVLAFINTVPSLATFSLPNYNTKGLPLKEGYAHFDYNHGIVHVDNFTLNSPEMKILGDGSADLKTQTLKGELTLKTDLGSVLGKVPVVGYILLGNDGSLSTTLTISGKLDDPKVETAIAKEIATAPFNILKRTLVYPFLWMIPDEKKKK
ncbi:MAG: AsmA-like C-terminal domain-containing protein [Sulfuricurvum sp.]|uniref:YhdP family protein n=1 Tax=Sulfuricurvum sp. TaxID=2025608 RepID=UPI00260C5C82|nr:AsmA-like C-terminal domain-containing protein [Sulfuricurvum sp.]MDD5118849.1 AsmA-like C-terminal domain-containing protein [Sulfuricurvum sp.]